LSTNGSIVDRTARDRDEVLAMMLSRLRSHVADWRAESPADLALTLVELLAAEADRLAYEQDAVGTEAYIGTARRRISVVRLGRLLGVEANNGCNARTWMSISVRDNEPVDLPKGTKLLTRLAGLGPLVDPGRADALIAHRSPLVFETMEPIRLRAAHNTMPLHAGPEAVVLPAGATSARLCGHVRGLRKGDALCLSSREAPHSDSAHIVRLDRPAEMARDEATGHDVTIVHWHHEDALIAPIRVTVTGDGSRCRSDVVVRGNLVLADHGRTADGDLEPNPTVGARWRLSAADLTFGEFTPDAALRTLSASAATHQDPLRAVPAIHLVDSSHRIEGSWIPTRDLLGCHRFARRFVVEVEDDGWAELRFGDGEHGQRVPESARLEATVRRGCGPVGNVSAGAIAHVVTDVPGAERVEAVTNVIAGRGGVAAETAAQYRDRAPFQWRQLEACVTPADYAEHARGLPGVRDAFGRWGDLSSGAVVELFVQGSDRQEPVRPLDDVKQWLEPRRVLGHVLVVRPAVPFELRIELQVVVKEGSDPDDITAELRAALGSARGGLFEEGRFALGERVYASQIVRTAAAVEGVAAVELTRFTPVGSAESTTVPASHDVAPWAFAHLAATEVEGGSLRIDLRADT
jgi:Baseplate J-like protein